MKKERGITLIALVITIIVLLILAGVTLNTALGQNGLFQRAKEAGERYKKAEEDEQKWLDDFDEQIKSLDPSSSEGSIEVKFKSVSNSKEPVPLNTDIYIYNDSEMKKSVGKVAINGEETIAKLDEGTYYAIPKEVPSDYNILAMKGFTVTSKEENIVEIMLTHEKTLEVDEEYEKVYDENPHDSDYPIKLTFEVLDEDDMADLSEAVFGVNLYKIGEYNEETNTFNAVKELKNIGIEGTLELNTYYQYRTILNYLADNNLDRVNSAEYSYSENSRR